MDKFEYKVKVDEIKSLIQKGAFEDAVDVADTVDWAGVKNVRTLCMVSDLYKKCRLFEESRTVLIYAYNKQKARSIVKSLCELSIELGDLLGAIEYCKEFVMMAPKDPNVFVLQYKIYKAQGISLEEQIEVLEQLKKAEYMEKWAYELATLYHKVGMGDKCVEECNELITWFVDGKYVMKAFELKALHKPLSESETYKYELLRQAGGELNIQYSLKEEAKSAPVKKELEVKNVDVSPYNTQSLQAVVAEGVQDVLEVPPVFEPENKPETREEAIAMDEAALNPAAPESNPELMVTTMYNAIIPEEPVGQELEKLEKPADETETKEEDVNFSDTDIIGDVAKEMAKDILMEKEYTLHQNTDEMKMITDDDLGITNKGSDDSFGSVFKDTHDENEAIFEKKIDVKKSELSNTGVIETFHKGSNMDDMLSQEYDGQISLVVPEETHVEQQITGQISIDDVMREWELKKKANEAKRIAEVKAAVRKQADGLFANFDEATKSGLLEQIENAMISAALNEEGGKPKQIKVADIPALEEEKKIKAEDAADLEKYTFKDLEEEPVTKEADKEEPKDQEPVKEEAPKEESDKVEAVKEELQEEEFDEVEEIAEIEDITEELKDIKDEIEEELKKESKSAKRAEKSTSKHGKRDLSEAERARFGPFVHHKSTRRQLVNVLDNFTLASYTGNVLVTSEEDYEVTTFSKLLVKEIQMSDSNFTGKVAKVSGDNLNKKDVAETLKCVTNGALIISEAEGLRKTTVENLLKELQQTERGVIVVMQGHADVIDKIVEKNEGMAEAFNLRVDLKAFDNKTLVEYAKTYAYDSEYTLDELGVLALHQRIDDMQTSDHEVTLSDVEELIDEAIYYADKKTPSHFFDILFGKRYDEEDMIILREKDFMHY